jgi:CRISPR-associated protein Csm5
MDRNQKESVRNKIRNNADTYGQRVNRNIYLKRETEEIEAQVFHTLDYVPEKRNNAANSNMSGFIVSDSKPLTVKDLTLSQKIDVTMDGAEKPLPILRETLKPGTDISFSITIDSKSFPYSIQDIKDAIQVMGEVCQEHFFDHLGMDTYREGAVWIGGGSGFLSKTIIYALFDHEEAVKITDQIFKITLAKNYSVHKHNKDLRLGLAPHTCKCTRYDGMLLPMGKGIISF